MKYPSPILTFQNLKLGYYHSSNADVLLNDFQEELPSRKLIALIGPNGAGKSTLLRTIAGMQKPLSGDIKLLGKSLFSLSARELAKHLSVVLTDRQTISYLKASEVVAMGRFPHTGWLGNFSNTDRRKVEAAVQQASITHLMHKAMYQLSDGERQKVMIARALAQDTPLMILDEPTTHLDVVNRTGIIDLLRTLVHKQKKSIIYSTHDIELALQVADRIWLMHDQSITNRIPEDLVLDGTLTEVMSNALAPFDLNSGTFRVVQKNQIPIRLIGSGVRTNWTKRALERSGYRISTEDSQTINVDESGYWLIENHETKISCRSIEEVLINLSQVSTYTNKLPHASN